MTSSPTFPRTVLPPWQIQVAFAALIGGRFLAGSLSLFEVQLHIVVVQTLMASTAIALWYWPTPASELPSWRFAVLSTVAAVVLDVLLDLDPMIRWLTGSEPGKTNVFNFDVFMPHKRNLVWPSLVGLPIAVYNALLAHPFAKLFWALRQNRDLPSSMALGPSGLFLLYAALIPAALQLGHAVRVWVLLFVPLAVALLMLYVRGCRDHAGQPVHPVRALTRLVVSHAFWIVLFVLGEISAVFVTRSAV